MVLLRNKKNYIELSSIPLLSGGLCSVPDQSSQFGNIVKTIFPNSVDSDQIILNAYGVVGWCDGAG